MFLSSISWASEPGLGERDVVGRDVGQGVALHLEEISWENNVNIIIIIVVIVIIQNHHHLEGVDGGRNLKWVEGCFLWVWVHLRLWVWVHLRLWVWVHLKRRDREQEKEAWNACF